MDVLNKVKTRVLSYMNEALTIPYTEEEVKRALFSIGDLKTPGPDGLHTVFYKKNWPLLGDDLVREVLVAVNSGVIPEGWNVTTVLIQRLKPRRRFHNSDPSVFVTSCTR